MRWYNELDNRIIHLIYHLIISSTNQVHLTILQFLPFLQQIHDYEVIKWDDQWDGWWWNGWWWDGRWDEMETKKIETNWPLSHLTIYHVISLSTISLPEKWFCSWGWMRRDGDSLLRWDGRWDGKLWDRW